MATTEVKEEQKVYVCLPYIYDEGKNILSWALSHFPKDETKIVATYIGPTSYILFRNMWRKFYNETLDKHLAQCAIQKFKAEKLIPEIDHQVKGTLGPIDIRAITNLVIESSPTNSELVKEKANPSCMIWFIQNGHLIDFRLPRLNPKATSEEMGLHEHVMTMGYQNMGSQFSLRELEQATQNFSDLLKIEDANEEKNKVIIEQKELEAFKGKDKEYTSGAFVQECKYFSTPRGCKLGKSCRYLHPKGKPDVSPVQLNFLGLPIRPNKKECPYYMLTGSCKYSTYCKFNHPDPTAVASPTTQAHPPVPGNNNKKNNNYGSSKEKAAPTTQAHPPVPVPSVPSWPEQGTSLKEPMQYVAAAPPSYGPGIMPPHGMLPNQDWNSYQQIRREKRHQEEIEEIQKRENDKNDLLKREIEQLKLENQLQQNELDKQKQQLRELISDLEIGYDKLKQERDNAIKELDKQKQQLGELISDLEIGYNKLKQERDNAIKEAQELRRQKEHSFGNSDMVLGSQFSLRELEQATQNFSDSLKIGEGGFGCVYKGSLRNTTVAIKKLNSESLQGLSEFQREVAILNRVRHPNIVNLIGSCSEISTLVYEFLPNGSLEDRLACADNTSSLKWQTRIRIISEICLGLVFLHSNKPHLVIHGDLKPDNILLDANFISKLSDFGISRMIKQSDTNTTALYRTTHPAGTFAYVDPQFHSTGELTPKSDVYSFGIIVLRLLTGKRALNIANEVQEGMRAGRLLSIVDQSAGKWPFDPAEKLAKLGLRCADISRRTRPDMSQVWATIEPLVKDASLLSVGSSTSNEEHVPSHFICPIMQGIMKNPCIAADGFTYEAEAIKTWLNRGRHNKSPMTNLVLPHRDLIPNLVLRSAIQEWLQQHPQSN